MLPSADAADVFWQPESQHPPYRLARIGRMTILHRSAALACLALLSVSPVGAREFEFIDPAALGFGSPAFTLDSTYQSTLDYENRAGGLESFELRAVAPLAAKKAGSLLAAASLGYSWRHVDFGPGFGLGKKDLYSIEAQFTLAWRPEGSKWWALGFITPGIASDLEGVDSDAFKIAGLALVGYRVSPTLDLAGGVFAGYSLDNAQVIPAVGVIWRPSEQLVFQVTPPIVAIGWQPNRDWSVALVGYPGGGGWEVEETASGVRQVELDLWRAAVSVERRIGENWRVSVRGGMAFGGELELRDSDARVISSSDLEAAPFGAIAVKWAF